MSVQARHTSLVDLTITCESQVVLLILMQWPSYMASSVGTDAARAFATGCFKEHKTHDIRGLNDDELRVRPVFMMYFVNPLIVYLFLGPRALEEILCRTQGLQEGRTGLA